MDKRARLVLFVLLVALGWVSAAKAHGTLQPGEYQVTTRLELPHVEDMEFTRQARICVTDGGTHGLVVLSDNNPLARCPAFNIWENGDNLTFDLVCEGHNQAIASAKFSLYVNRFEGIFDMKMGGKNMTMTERQTGLRVGPCANPTPRSWVDHDR